MRPKAKITCRFVTVSSTPRVKGRLMFLLAWHLLMVSRLGDHGQWSSWLMLTSFDYINEALDREPIDILENCFGDQNDCIAKSLCCLETTEAVAV